MKSTIWIGVICCIFGLTPITYSAIAQSFEIKALDVPTKHFVSAGDISKNGRFILYDDFGPHFNSCPTLFDRKTKKVRKLCEQGVATAFRVNNSGSVVGISLDQNDDEMAVVWTVADGLTTLTQAGEHGFAFDINEQGAVVGALLKTVEYNYSEDGSEPSQNTARVYTAFRWTKGEGRTLLLPDLAQYSSAAVNINNRGDILALVSKQTAPSESIVNDAYFDVCNYEAYLLIGNKRDKKSLPADQFDCNEPSEQGNYGSDLSEKREVLFSKFLFRPKKKRVSVARRFAGGRDDTIRAISIGDGIVAGFRGGSAFLDRLGRGAVRLECLFPQNKQILGSSRASGLRVEYFGGIAKSGEMLVSGNLEGDGFESRLFIIKEAAGVGPGALTDYCPDLNFDIRCDSEGDSEGNGAACQANLSVKSNGESYPHTEISVWASDVDGYYNGLECPEMPLGSLFTDSNGFASKQVTSNHNFIFCFRVPDPKLRVEEVCQTAPENLVPRYDKGCSKLRTQSVSE